jgi:hypothetical protein
MIIAKDDKPIGMLPPAKLSYNSLTPFYLCIYKKFLKGIYVIVLKSCNIFSARFIEKKEALKDRLGQHSAGLPTASNEAKKG